MNTFQEKISRCLKAVSEVFLTQLFVKYASDLQNTQEKVLNETNEKFSFKTVKKSSCQKLLHCFFNETK